MIQLSILARNLKCGNALNRADDANRSYLKKWQQLSQIRIQRTVSEQF